MIRFVSRLLASTAFCAVAACAAPVHAFPPAPVIPPPASTIIYPDPSPFPVDTAVLAPAVMAPNEVAEPAPPLIIEAAHHGNPTPVVAPSGGTTPAVLVCAACDAVPTSWTNHIYYVKPTGNDASAGTSLGTAWATPGKARDTMVDGDLTLLETGSYGDLDLTGNHHSAFVAMVADAGQTPQFSTMEFQGTTHWALQNILVKLHTSGTDLPLVSVAGDSTNGASSNISLDHFTFESDDDATVAGWDAAAWVANARRWAILIDGQDVSSTYAKKISLTSSTVKNIRGGIGLTADDLLVADTTIDNIADDGIDFAGNRILIKRTGCSNIIAIGDGNHNDCMQGQIGHGFGSDGSDDNGSGPTTTYDDVVIDGAWFYNRTHPAASMPLFTSGYYASQGIGNFDMDWNHFKIINSIVVGDATALIGVASVHNALIANNVVLNTKTNYLADYSGGIAVVRYSHEGAASDNVVVRNNYTSNLQDNATMITNIYDHNYTDLGIIWNVGGSPSFNHSVGTYTDYSGSATNFLTATAPSSFFVTVDLTNGVFDFHPKVGSPGIGAGGPGAPNKTDGTVRGSSDDIGPY